MPIFSRNRGRQRRRGGGAADVPPRARRDRRAALKIIGVDTSPFGPGKTYRMISEILTGSSVAGAETELVRHDSERVLELIAAADGVVFGSPTYRASPSAAMRLLLERIDRNSDEGPSPLQGTPVIAAMTGASAEHFLATRELSNALSGFFGTLVLAPDIYIDGSSFRSDGTLDEVTAGRLRHHGAALAELAAAIQGSRHLRELRPWI